MKKVINNKCIKNVLYVISCCVIGLALAVLIIYQNFRKNNNEDYETIIID